MDGLPHLFSERLQLKALKFMPSHRIIPADLPVPYLEYLNPRTTLAAPYPSPLASQLLNVDGVASVFYGSDYITVTKTPETDWAHVKPEILSLITEAIASGTKVVNFTGETTPAGSVNINEQSSVNHDTEDEVVGLIKELLETRIRPAIQDDGGDIEFRGFEHGNVLLKLRGACRTCDSSVVTLKNGIESMLMHYVSIFRIDIVPGAKAI